jgi:bifunctional DNA-binding transcriptional regulator/antitoxin component of YhaV-PrlF toxin-antitoxin module
MVNYTNGNIYKIECKNATEDDGDVYIGSICKHYLSQRMDTHRHGYIGYKLGGLNLSKTNSYDIFDKYGIDNCHIILVKSFPCASKDELTAREAHYIKTIKYVNKVIPMQTREEYRTDNKDIIALKKREYKQAHKGEIVICECGRELTRDKKRRHLKTLVHLRYLESIANIEPSV